MSTKKSANLSRYWVTYSSLWKTHCKAMERHLPYGITTLHDTRHT